MTLDEFKTHFRKTMDTVYYDLVPPVHQHRDMIRVYVIGWIENAMQALERCPPDFHPSLMSYYGSENLMGLMEALKLEISETGWSPDDSWKWWVK